jgi:hypothetical protein
MAAKKKMLKYEALFQEWLKSREWDDELEIDQENKSTQLGTMLEVNGQGYEVFLQGSDESDVVRVILYPPYIVRENKRNEACILTNEINQRIKGKFLIFADDGKFQFFDSVDLRGTSPSVVTIENLAGLAMEICAFWDPHLAAMAMTKITTAEILEEISKASEEDTDEVPDSL